MYRDDLCLHELFELQARKTPGAPAVAGGGGELTYGQLDRKADQLATYLQGEGVGPDEVVGVYTERRLEFVVACLAALKAGGAFLPLELAHPPSLLGDVLDDSEPRVILTQVSLAQRLPEKQARFCLDDGWEDAIGGDAGRPDGPRPGLENLMFVSYSSGDDRQAEGHSEAAPRGGPLLPVAFRLERLRTGRQGRVRGLLYLGSVSAAAQGRYHLRRPRRGDLRSRRPGPVP